MSACSIDFRVQRLRCFALQLFIQQDSVPLTPHPISKFYIFNRRSRDSAPRRNRLPQGIHLAYRSATGPKGLRLAASLLMHEAVEQVFILRDEIFLRRLVIIGTEHRCKFRVIHKVRCDSFERVGLLRLHRHQQIRELRRGLFERQNSARLPARIDATSLGQVLPCRDRSSRCIGRAVVYHY